MTLPEKAGQITALGPDAFGDATDYATGSTEFLVTDIDLPGTGPAVRLQRRFDTSDDGMWGWFGWTEFEVPHLDGVFASDARKLTGLPNGNGWVVNNLSAPENRCSSIDKAPPEVGQSNGKQDTFFPEEWWHGARA